MVVEELTISHSKRPAYFGKPQKFEFDGVIFLNGKGAYCDEEGKIQTFDTKEALLESLNKSGQTTIGDNASEPEPVKHDGNLDDGMGGRYTCSKVEITTYYGLESVHVYGGHGDIESNNIHLDAKQALSLSDWLNEKRATLEQLAKEQE